MKTAKKMLFAFVATLTTLSFVACVGGKGEEETKTIDASQVKISGESSDAIEVDANEVTIMLVNTRDDVWEVRAKTPLKASDSYVTPDKFEGYVSIDADYLDANGNEIVTDNGLTISSDDIKSILSSSSKSTEDVIVKFAWENLNHMSYKEGKAMFDKVSGVKIKLTISGYTATSSSATSSDDDDDDDDEVASSSSSSEDWDKVLDEYEKYVDQYVKLYKKAMNGDMSAMTEYASMLEKAESFSSKLEKAGDDLTAKHVARMNKINAKMLNAM